MIRMEKTGTNKLQCPQAKRLFSPYLDGAVTGTEMLALQSHLSECAACDGEYRALRRTQQLLTSVGRPKAPADLGLKLRLAISHEAAAAKRAPFEGMMVRLQNAMQMFMVPATAGFLSALVIFGVAMVYFVAPSKLHADNDVPLVMVNTQPEIQPSSYEMTMDTIDEDSLVIEAYVDANGRVEDYRILSDPGQVKQLSPEVKTRLLDFMTFTTYRPALSMGRPTPSKAVLSFSKINVKG